MYLVIVIIQQGKDLCTADDLVDEGPSDYYMETINNHYSK
jgi:hypothetical protein